MEKIITISWVRNEGDIIESFVRHHVAMVDRMIIVDHRSDDSTSHILRKLEEEGLPIEIKRDDRIAHEQSKVLTEILHSVPKKFGNAWVLPLDADEFIRTKKDTLRNTLKNLPNDTEALKVQWTSYVPTENDEYQVCPLQRIRKRLKRETRNWHKVLIRMNPSKRDESTSLSFGNHELLRKDGSDAEATFTDDIFLAHVPVRSKEQLTKKIVIGHLSTIASPHAPADRCAHWRSLYRFLESGKSLTPDILETIARTYANVSIWGEEYNQIAVDAYAKEHTEIIDDPIPTAYKLLYTEEESSALGSVLKLMEDLVLRERRIKESHSGRQ